MHESSDQNLTLNFKQIIFSLQQNSIELGTGDNPHGTYFKIVTNFMATSPNTFS